MNTNFGYIRVAAAVPKVRVADTNYNARQIIDLIQQADTEATDIIVFPECSITAYTANDLFHQIGRASCRERV